MSISLSPTLPCIENDSPLDDWIDKIDRILDHREEIKHNKCLQYVQCPDAGIDYSYLTGGAFYLGSLLQHWSEGKMLKLCPQYGHDVYLLRAGGSILSQRGYWTGLCPHCREIVGENRYIPLWKNLKRGKDYNALNKEILLKKGGTYSFDFRDGAQEPEEKAVRFFVPSWKEFLRWL